MLQQLPTRRRTLLALAGSGTLAACGSDKNSPNDLLSLLDADPSTRLLAEAITAAGLGPTLGGAGPFTVFAPSSTAFAILLAELGMSKEQLFANKTLLSAVLRYHLLPARVLKAGVPLGTAITTVQGESFSINANLQITDRNSRPASIAATDVLASNGVIHAIDRVLLPKIPTLVELAQATPQFSVLVEALVAARLVGALGGPAPLTVFAPTNDAFVALLAELGQSKEQLFANTALLTQVLTYHVLPGRVFRAGLPINTPISTLQGGRISVDSNLRITDARGRQAAITATDALGLNGLVHTIDRVVLPK